MSILETRIAYKGQNKTLREWAHLLGITEKAIETRYKRSLLNKSQPAIKDLFRPMRSYATENGTPKERLKLVRKIENKAVDYKRERVAYKGRNLMLCEWADLLEISYEGLATRFASGKRGAALFRVI